MEKISSKITNLFVNFIIHFKKALVTFKENSFSLSEDYFTKCVRDSDEHNVQGYARYTIALQDAIRGFEPRLVDTDPACDF